MKDEKNYSLEGLVSGALLHFKFKKMMCKMKKSESRFGTMFIIEDPLEGSMTADVIVENGNVVIELPKTSLINERGGININNIITANGVFVKEDSDYAPICYHMSSEIDVRIFKKETKVFSFICLPAISSKPNYRGYDTLFIELAELND